MMKFLLKFIILPFVLMGVVAMVGAFVAGRYIYQESIFVVYKRAIEKEVNWQEAKYPSINFVFSAIKYFYAPDPSKIFHVRYTQDITDNLLSDPPKYVGPSPTRATEKIASTLSTMLVSTEKEVIAAIKGAKAGDTIVILAGDYNFRQHNIPLLNNGSKDHPITLRADLLGDVTLNLNTLEGLYIRGAYWHIENLIIEGVCKSDSRCEHAFHVVGDAHHTVLKNNIVKNFNSPVKINGSKGKIPDFGTIEHNIFYNDAPRETNTSVTLIDSVAASHWQVKGNIIADFAKEYGDNISYGGFFKGGGRSNIFEQNLIMCEWRHRGGTRLGLSFGGGGTGSSFCPDNDCSTEHYEGIIRNNIIMNCPRDVGIYLNRSAATLIYNNIIYNTHGIDVRFDTTTAKIFNNVIDGRIRSRNGGSYGANNNVISFAKAAQLKSITEVIYKNPWRGNFQVQDRGMLKKQGVTARSLGNDICQQPQMERQSDIGPFNLQNGNECSMDFGFIQEYIK